MNHIIPTIFATSKEEFDNRLKKLLPSSSLLQVDFMDGRFVDNESVLLSSVPSVKKYDNSFEAHLMVASPKSYFKKLKSKGFVKVIFHFEAVADSDDCRLLISSIHALGMKAFIAINPKTSISKVKDLISDVDGFLLMGVNPGKEHQEFIPSTISKIKQLRKLSKKLFIQVDGGVTIDNIDKLVKAGVSAVNSGSLVYNSLEPREMVKKLNSYFK